MISPIISGPWNHYKNIDQSGTHLIHLLETKLDLRATKVWGRCMSKLFLSKVILITTRSQKSRLLHWQLARKHVCYVLRIIYLHSVNNLRLSRSWPNRLCQRIEVLSNCLDRIQRHATMIHQYQAKHYILLHIAKIANW